MTKTITTHAAIELYEELCKIAKSDKQLPGQVAWAVSLACKSLEPINENFVNVRNTKIKQMLDEDKATQDEETGEIHLKDEALIVFLRDVMESEVTISFSPISKEAFDKLLDDYEFSVAEIGAISSLVKED